MNVEDMRARIKVGILLAKLDKDASGEEKLTEGQRASIKLLIDKAMPTLQAVETTQIEPAAALTKDGEKELLRALILQHPDLVQEVLGEMAKGAGPDQDRAAMRLVQDGNNTKAA